MREGRSTSLTVFNIRNENIPKIFVKSIETEILFLIVEEIFSHFNTHPSHNNVSSWMFPMRQLELNVGLVHFYQQSLAVTRMYIGEVVKQKKNVQHT